MKKSKIISLENRRVVTKNSPEWLQNTRSMPKKLKYMIENTHAMHEINRIFTKQEYSMETVWREAYEWYEEEILSEKAGQDTWQT